MLLSTEIQTKRQERKRRSTANPAYSGLFEPEVSKSFTLIYCRENVETTRTKFCLSVILYHTSIYKCTDYKWDDLIGLF